MSGTNGALRILELASARLWHEITLGVGQHDGAPAMLGRFTPPADPFLARLELWHAAWGPDQEPRSIDQIATAAHGLPGHIRLDGDALPPGTLFPATSARIVLNLVLLAAESLPAGGIVILAGSADDLFVRIAGPAAAWPTGLALCLADQPTANAALLEQTTLQAAVTSLLAHEAGIRLSLVMPPSGNSQPPILRLGG